MENKIKISVACKDEAAKTKYEELSAKCGSTELSDEALETVVGGKDSSFFNVFTSAVSVIPVGGPIVSAIAKAIKAGTGDGDVNDVFLNLAVGAGLAMFDSVSVIATMGAGATFRYGVNFALGLGKGCLNKAL